METVVVHLAGLWSPQVRDACAVSRPVLWAHPGGLLQGEYLPHEGFNETGETWTYSITKFFYVCRQNLRQRKIPYEFGHDLLGAGELTNLEKPINKKCAGFINNLLLFYY